jgi:nitric oxide reductase large subunit
MTKRKVIITEEEFKNGIKEYNKKEKPELVYDYAVFIVNRYWSSSEYTDILEIAYALKNFLLTIDTRFYKKGSFDLDKLKKCVEKNIKCIESFRNRDIFSLSDSDQEKIEALFNDFVEALSVELKNGKVNRGTAPAAKALHILAPHFFPMWNRRIAIAYGCRYRQYPAKKYFSFCKIMREVAEEVKEYKIESDKTILKLIYEYNYAKYTKEWI